MNKFIAALGTTAAILTSATAVQAADIPLKAIRSVAPPRDLWTGFYGGINFGYGVSRSSFTDITTLAPGLGGLGLFTRDGNLGLGGGIIGGQIGYNWVFMPGWLWGIEADIQYSNQVGSSTLQALVVPAFESVSASLQWFGTLRGRVGALTGGNTTLWYFTGGLAYGARSVSVSAGIPAIGAATATGSTDGTDAGYVLGAGVETKIFGPWSAKLEYLYMDLGSLTASATTNVGGIPLTTTTANVNFRDHMMRAGINYKF